jgi:hypothetical protein
MIKVIFNDAGDTLKYCRNENEKFPKEEITGKEAVIFSSSTIDTWNCSSTTSYDCTEDTHNFVETDSRICGLKLSKYEPLILFKREDRLLRLVNIFMLHFIYGSEVGYSKPIFYLQTSANQQSYINPNISLKNPDELFELLWERILYCQPVGGFLSGDTELTERYNKERKC